MLPLLSLSVDTSSSPATEIATGTLGPPTLALLGGFSASVVYQILTRMASAVESMFHGDMRTRMSVAEQAWKTRQQEQLVQQKVDMAMRVNAVLVVTSHGDIAVVQRELERLQTDLLSSRPTLGGSAPNRSAVDS
jgi:hypothetical protein